MKNFFRLIICIAICELAGFIGAIFTTPEIGTWYRTLVKPVLNPPSWVFGPVWTTLFALLGIALFLVWQRQWRVRNQITLKTRKAWNPYSEQLWKGRWQRFNVIAIFVAQYILNILWSYAFFDQHAPSIAFLVLVALWISIVYLIVNFYRISKLAAWLLVPYLAWVTFAGYLNFAIWMLNKY